MSLFNVQLKIISINGLTLSQADLNFSSAAQPSKTQGFYILIHGP